MKFAYLLLPLATVFTADALAQARIWRCGNTYTNEEIKGQGCKLVEGGNVTVVQGTKVNGVGAPVAANTPRPATSGPQAVVAPGANQRVDSTEQRARDGDARMILEAELKKAEARQAELQKEYNNGEPEKLGPETKNYQKYLDRVAELKASIERNEKDIIGLKRELGRTPAPAATAAAPSPANTPR